MKKMVICLFTLCGFNVFANEARVNLVADVAENIGITRVGDGVVDLLNDGNNVARFNIRSNRGALIVTVKGDGQDGAFNVRAGEHSIVYHVEKDGRPIGADGIQIDAGQIELKFVPEGNRENYHAGHYAGVATVAVRAGEVDDDDDIEVENGHF